MSGLRLDDVWASRGSLVALHGVCLDVPAGCVGTLLGANGAGKSSTLLAIAGMLPVHRGSIEFQGTRIDGADVASLVRAGVALVPEGRRLFAERSVHENLLLGGYVRGDQAAVRGDLDRVADRFPVLAERAEQPAGLLSGGEQQMLAVARALMSRPRLLLLDEPSAGLAPLVAQQVFSAVRRVADEEGVTVLLAEQQAELALRCADVGFVLAGGRVVVGGRAHELAASDAVRRSYLGD